MRAALTPLMMLLTSSKGCGCGCLLAADAADAAAKASTNHTDSLLPMLMLSLKPHKHT
jgi:hypothetical protein